MDISWSTISTGAMTAAVSLGSTLQHVGTGAANAAATALPAAASAMPAAPSIAAGAAGTSQLAQNLALVEKPVAAAAQGVRVGFVARAASFLGKALPIATITASAMSGAQIVDKHGLDALIETKKGRAAVLGAVGGSLLLMPFPPAKLAAAGMLALTAVNQLDGLHALDRSQITGKPVPLPSK